MAALLSKSLVQGLPLLAPQPHSQRRTGVRAAAVQQEVRPVVETSNAEDAASSAQQGEEIYIGFPKNDYARPPGRKGRMVRDDPRKYPGREDLGFFQGAVGGWAGGEAGLWKLREEYQRTQSQLQGPGTPAAPAQESKRGAKKAITSAASAGKDAIYVGFGKDELELRKSGVQGRVIYDEAYKYPDREDMGALRGVVGGFAGGEAGLRHFAETGELKLRKPGDPLIKKQVSPLSVAFLVMLGAAGGGVVLTGAVDLGDLGVQEVMQAPIDETTKKLLLVAVGLLGAAGAVGALRAVFQAVRDRLSAGAEGAQKVAVSAAFFAAVFVAARAILESP